MTWTPIQTAFPDLTDVTRNFDSTVSMPGTITFTGSVITATGVRAQVGVGDSAGTFYLDLPQKNAVRFTYLSYSASLDGGDPSRFFPAGAKIRIGGDVPGGGFLDRTIENNAVPSGGAISAWEATGGQPVVLAGVAEIGLLPENDFTRLAHLPAYVTDEFGDAFDSLYENFSILIEVWVGPFVEEPGPPDEQQVFVYTMNRVGAVGAWSRYIFPFNIDATAQLGETLYLRAGDTVYRVDDGIGTDDIVAGESVTAQQVVGIVQWPWLDFGQPGQTKMMQALDVVGSGPGDVSLQVGYDQRSVEAFTPAYTIPIDTLTGMPVPMPVSAPTFSVRLTFTGEWSLQAVNVYLADNRRTT